MKSRVTYFLVLVFLVMAGTSIAGDGKMPITTSSDEARQAYLHGMEFMDTLQPEKARPFFEKAVKLDPDFILATIGLARSQGQIKDTRAIMQKVEKMAGTVEMSEGERLFVEGLLAAFNADRATFVANQEKLAEMFPRDERILFNLGGIYYGTNEYEKAVSVLKQGQKANPEFIPIYNLLGYSLREMGEEDQAAAIFKKAIELDPQNPNGYDSYAELLLKMGRYDESIASYERVLEIEPLFPSEQIGIASNLLHLNRHDEARARLAELFDVAPDDGVRSGVHWALSVTWVDQGDLDRALAELEKNYALSKKSHDAGAMSVDLNNMAGLLVEAGRYDEAQAKYDESLKLILESDRAERAKEFARAGSLYNKAFIACRKGDLETAHARAAEYQGRGDELNNPFFTRSVHQLLGIVALAENDWETAVAELRQADTTDAYNMYRIGLAYEGMNNREEAREMFRYVTTYRGSLNYNYSLVRHDAEKKLTVQ